MTPPDLAAMDLLYQLGELAATGGDIRGPGWRAKESTGSCGPCCRCFRQEASVSASWSPLDRAP